MTGRLIAVLLGLVLVLAGCSASTSDDALDGGAPDLAAPAADRGSGDDSGGDAAEGEAGDAAAEQAAVGSDVGTVADVPDGEGPMMVRRVELEVQVGDVSQAVTRARATATGAGGWVESEEVVPGDDERPGYASIVLRVPSQGLDSVVTSLGELGEVTGSRSSAEDVKAEYRDVEARVATLEAGAQRLRELVAEAGSVSDIANLERELAAREADLDALKARMKVLEEDVSRSTITLHLAEEGAEVAQTSTRGFLPGLRQGWEAFTGSVTVLLTALGAVLPFLLLATLLVLPLLWWRRRRAVRPAASLGSDGDRHAAAAGDPDRS
ncbi:DUF4349 domain-containing protein [Ornithinimicrobium flavum]|uniref:DUF4349 domain-containing protein n=1 Tax=Ornithinimicrobium flavum TaxID=1288636 RepID=UPI00106FF6F7|nr:DUF4349 domain-containing protein [Ornithinimicrobium flavum]